MFLMTRVVRARCPRRECQGRVTCVSVTPFKYQCDSCKFRLSSAVGFTEGVDEDL